jgi:ATP-binding cassette subfamily A (ABC1) protein 3
MSFIPASIITIIVRERVELIKHQQLVSGVGIFSYWLSHYVVDFLKHLFPAAICIAMVVAFDITAFNGTSKLLGATSLLFILYGWAMFPFTYLAAYLFDVKIIYNFFFMIYIYNFAE